MQGAEQKYLMKRSGTAAIFIQSLKSNELLELLFLNMSYKYLQATTETLNFKHAVIIKPYL